MIKFLLKLFSRPSGFGSAGIRRHRICGALLVLGGPPWSQAQRGVELPETGINISRFSCRYYPAVIEKLPNNAGEPIARVTSDKWSRDITIAGEVLVGGGGVMAFTLATACIIANDVNVFTPTGGSILLEEVTETQERGGWRAIDMRLSSDPNLVLP